MIPIYDVHPENVHKLRWFELVALTLREIKDIA